MPWYRGMLQKHKLCDNTECSACHKFDSTDGNLLSTEIKSLPILFISIIIHNSVPVITAGKCTFEKPELTHHQFPTEALVLTETDCTRAIVGF